MTGGSDYTSPERWCPVCDGRGIPIVWGDPTTETLEAVALGEVAIGGCLIPTPTPRFECDAGHRWGPFGVSPPPPL